MKNLDWIVIFRLNEFIGYFTKSELIQLSLSCKAFRTCLSRPIFSSFNFTSFAYIGNYKSCIVSNNEYKSNRNMIFIYNPFKVFSSDLTISKSQFNLDLELISNKPTKLIVYNAEYYYHLLYDIPSVFTKLTTIIISHSSLRCELLQYLLDTIEFLDSLEVTNSSLIQFAQSSDLIPIDWPKSLKKLKVCNNRVTRVEDRKKDLLLVNGRLMNSLNVNLVFTLKHLPKLVSFEYQLLVLQFDDENLWVFLKLNPQITSLIIRVPDFHSRLFSAIKSVGNLSSLHLIFMINNSFEVDYSDLPILDSITSLTITLYNKPDINDIPIEKFPNLVNLTVEMDSKDSVKLTLMTKKLSNVKNFGLKIIFQSLNIKKFNFPKIYNLNSLEFILDSNTYLNDINWNVDSCPNLKVVSFSKVKSLIYKNQPKNNPELIDNWKVIYFPHKVKYYRTT